MARPGADTRIHEGPTCDLTDGSDQRRDSAVEGATAMLAVLTEAINTGRLDELSPDLVQALVAAAIRTYCGKIEAGGHFLPLNFQTAGLTPTDVMTMASGLLKSGDLQVFELGMWQSYTGR